MRNRFEQQIKLGRLLRHAYALKSGSLRCILFWFLPVSKNSLPLMFKITVPQKKY